jgi:hypothetical protein
MRKYLMTGVAALAICAAFTSCSKGEELYDQGAIDQGKAVSIVESYNQAFLKYIGANSAADIPANQTWGFGGYAAGTRGYSTNHNLWGDPNADGGKWNYKVPPALTDRQRLRVKLYFQYNPWLTYQDPEWTDFFVQQVYKGGTSPIASQSLEVYPTGNGGSAVGGQQMDKLTVGTTGEGAQTANYYDHVNDFNNGDYDGGNKVAVLNTGGNTNNAAAESHLDQITLMLSSKSDCVGYWSSNGSTGHNDRCALAGADVIDAWATSAAAIALGIDLGDPVYDEEWNRSFVGLDYDGVYGDNIYAKELDSNWQPTNNIRYATFEDAKNGKEYAWDGKNVVKIDDLIAIDPYIRDKEGNKVPYTINQRNMFIGENEDISQGDLIIQKEGYGDVIDLTVIYGKINDACLPCDGKLYEWTKNIGGRDHVYSDWIVTLTKAEKQEIVVDPDNVCIIAEDLSATDATDFDFNDVVFTVEYIDNNSATITLYAAGGTLPLKVAGEEVHAKFGYGTVDEKGLYKMINTNRQGADGVNGVNPVSWTVSGIQKSNRGSDIIIEVDKGEKNANGVIENHNWLTLTATGGQPAAKLCVGSDFATEHKWCDERESIKTKYPVFSDWALNNPTQIWWR